MFRPRLASLSLVAFYATVLPANASPLSATVVGAVDCSFITCDLRDAKIDGQIDHSTVGKVRQLIEKTKTAAVQQKKTASFDWGFELDSPGGSVAAAIEIGRVFRKERVSVAVPHWAQCHSACVLMLVGAVNRLIAGKVGIHRPYLEVPQQEVTPDNVKSSYQRMLQDIRAYFREMNVSEQLADAMLRIDPSNIQLLDQTAFRNYGITATDPIEQETLDLEDAKYWGLDRQEYMRRKSLASTVCPGRFGVPDSGTPCYRTVMKTGSTPAPAQTPDFSQFGTPAR